MGAHYIIIKLRPSANEANNQDGKSTKFLIRSCSSQAAEDALQTGAHCS